MLFLLLVATVTSTHILKSSTKSEQLQTLSRVTTLPHISISASHWEETELFPSLKNINYTDFTYAK